MINLQTLNTFNKMSQTPAKPQQTPMTPQQSEQIKAKLRKEFRVNVYPNRFNIDVPYQVSVNYKGKFTNHGSFTNLEVASAVGSIAGTATFGKKALVGEFDAEVAQNHPEFIAWMEDERNVEVIKDYNNNITL